MIQNNINIIININILKGTLFPNETKSNRAETGGGGGQGGQGQTGERDEQKVSKGMRGEIFSGLLGLLGLLAWKKGPSNRDRCVLKIACT
jgi:hypothetical protein